jgi:chromosome partitioning protein
MQIISIANQKGGVGKTTTAVNLSACLARAGQSVLLIDLDQQANATQHLGLPAPDSEADSSYALLVESKPNLERLTKPIAPNLSVIPAHIALAEVDLKLASAVNPDGRLRRALSDCQVDYVVIDCPPSLGRATINALSAATRLIVAVQTHWFAYEAVQRLITIVDDVVDQSNPSLEVYALATMVKANQKMDGQVLARVREVFGDHAFQTIIRHTVAFVEAAAAGQSIIDYAHGSRGHQDYANLAKEVTQRYAQTIAQTDYSAVAN